MAKDHARVNVTIWSDPDFRALPPAAQHLYLLLWTSPDLSYCGVHDWRPAKLTGLSQGFTKEHIATIGACLAARHFLVIDEETEEVLVRSWARFDGLMKQPRMAVSYASAYATVGSQVLRQVIAHETAKMKKAHPEFTCWKDKRVAEILEHPAVSAKDLPVPSDPFGDGFGDGFALGLPQTQPKVYPSVWGSPTPAPAPATSPYSRTAGAAQGASASASADAERESTEDKGFAEWYSAYPRKKGKGQAVKAYRAAIKKPGVTPDSLLAALTKQLPELASRPADKVPYPATWLNGEHWENEPDNVRPLHPTDELPPLPSKSPWGL